MPKLNKKDCVCGNCIHWINQGTVGPCKRHSPVVSGRKVIITAEWPITDIEDGCGDWEGYRLKS